MPFFYVPPENDPDSPYLKKDDGLETSRGQLPHWDRSNRLQFVTLHLADSLPSHVRESMNIDKNNWLKLHPKPWSEHVQLEYNRRFVGIFEQWLDAGYGSCCLADRECATIVAEEIAKRDGDMYELAAYVVVSNHVHLLININEGHDLEEVMKGLKGSTTIRINKRLGKAGPLWHREYFDRMIRGERHYVSVIRYIQKNMRNHGVLMRIK